MAFFEWNKQLQTGIQKIDEQHKKLVSIVNLLYDSMIKGEEKNILKTIINELIEYTKYHFSNEEQLFEKYNYARTEQHKKEHRELIEKVEDLNKKYERGDLMISIETLGFLVHWVGNHIMKEDMMYVNFLKDKEI